MKTTINVKVGAYSLSPQGKELLSVLCTFPRIILAEVNTHRMLSKNTSSSRAIPFNKMVDAIQNDPFIPIAFQKDHSGMQGSEYMDYTGSQISESLWIGARDEAITMAKHLNKNGATKQLCNRLLEPFMWTTMLITGSKEGWDNFFELRCPQYQFVHIRGDNEKVIRYKSWKEVCRNEECQENVSLLERLECNKGQAEIHMMDLAEKIYDAMNESTPEQLKAGEWHIPFRDKIQLTYTDYSSLGKITQEGIMNKVKISTAMNARTSYTIVGEEKEINYQRMIELHDRLISQNPPHSSPMEHCARAMSNEEYKSFFKGNIMHVGCEQEMYDDNSYSEDVLIPIQGQGWCRNYKGFIPYRHIIENK